MMASSDPQRKPRVILAACGSVAAVKFGVLCYSFSQWAEVRIVVTKSSLHFIDRRTLPGNTPIYCDEHEWHSWRKVGDMVLHIELCKWADILVIAPISANTLAKIAGGVCDNLLTSVVRSWDCTCKPLFVAPSMNHLTWRSPLTEQHCVTLEDNGITVIAPITHMKASEEASCAMAEPENIATEVKLYYHENVKEVGKV